MKVLRRDVTDTLDPEDAAVIEVVEPQGHDEFNGTMVRLSGECSEDGLVMTRGQVQKLIKKLDRAISSI